MQAGGAALHILAGLHCTASMRQPDWMDRCSLGPNQDGHAQNLRGAVRWVRPRPSPEQTGGSGPGTSRGRPYRHAHSHPPRSGDGRFPAGPRDAATSPSANGSSADRSYWKCSHRRDTRACSRYPSAWDGPPEGLSPWPGPLQRCPALSCPLSHAWAQPNRTARSECSRQRRRRASSIYTTYMPWTQ